MRSARAFTSMMVQSEIGVLRRLHGMLENDPISSRDEFADLMTAAFKHGGLEVRNLSDDLGYSFSTVHRWVEGRSAPHPSLWPRIVLWIMGAIEARVVAFEELESQRPKLELV